MVRVLLQLPAEGQRTVQHPAVAGVRVSAGKFALPIVLVIVGILVGPGINPAETAGGLQKGPPSRIVAQDAFDGINPQILPFQFGQNIGNAAQLSFVPGKPILAMSR